MKLFFFGVGLALTLVGIVGLCLMQPFGALVLLAGAVSLSIGVAL